MCGIVGYIGDKEAAPIIFEGLKTLEYRGYDSCGIATIDNGLKMKKDIGMIDAIHEKHDLNDLPGTSGIGHTRWATHGSVTVENAHPHLDCKGNIAIVHNGIISNYSELRAELEEKGHTFASETDTEAIVHLIEEHYDGDLEAAVISALKRVKGTYALLVLSKDDPSTLVCARKESPMVLGVGDGEIFVASDIASFLKHTKDVIPMHDGDYAVITKDGYSIKDIATGNDVEREHLEVDWDAEAAEKEGYPHFMLKEIFEEPQTIHAAMNVYPEDIETLAGMMKDADRIYIAAAGTSLHAGQVSEYWFSGLANKAVYPIDSSELMARGVIDDKTLIIGISQSGETYDTLAAMRYAKGKGARTAAIVNVLGSTATREADHVILQGSGIEISVCATKTFQSQLVILLRVALALARLNGVPREDVETELERVPELIEEVLKHNQAIRAVAQDYCTVPNYMYIGKGIGTPSALEGALKFKEITYHHAEGMSGGLLKHGTISLIDDNMYTIAMVPATGENRMKITSNIQEVKARDGTVIGVVSGEPVEQCDVNITVPACSEEISPLIFAPAYQLLAYHTAVMLERNVDKPRALAKSVTVE